MTPSAPRSTPRWQSILIVSAICLAVVVGVATLAIPAFSLWQLAETRKMPPHDLTLKVTGNQWNWTYEYPDQKIPAFSARMLGEASAHAKGAPFRLATDEAVVVPTGKVVRVLVTASDVIHAWGVPAFGVVIDAIPGRVNETWFKADRTGVYYGQCREVCGVDHAFMPVEIHAVSQAEFDAWVAARAAGSQPAKTTATAQDHT